MIPLRLIHPSRLADPRSVDLSLERTSEGLRAHFEVRSAVPAYVNPALQGDSIWGLWEWDVVELFLRIPGQPDYYEFQVSPLGQVFELHVFEPRKRMDRAYRSGLRAQVGGDPLRGSWNATLMIPVKSEEYQGGGFAVLGPPERRGYWATFLPSQETPDFHLPEAFQTLPLKR